MTLAKDLIGGGFTAPQAIALGGGVNLALVATGSVQGDAALVGSSNTIVTGADATKGVILPAANPGESVVLFNSSAQALKVYPPTGAAIAVPGTSLGAANTAYSLTTFGQAIFTCVSATQWLVNKSA